MYTRTLLAALLFCMPSTGFGQVSLQHAPEYRKGLTIRSEVTVDTDQTLSLGEMDVETSASTFMITVESVTGQTDDGDWSMHGRFETLQSNVSIPGGLEFRFDSGNPDAAQPAAALQPIADLMRTLAGAEWTTLTGPDGKVKSIEFDGDPLSAVPETFRSQFSPRVWKQAANQTVDRLPGKPVRVSRGDSWTRSETSDLGGGQTMTFEKKYTYLGPTEKDGRQFEKIGVEFVGVTYAMKADPGSPLKVAGSELNIAGGEGEVLYSPRARTIVGINETVRITGTLDLDVNGQPLPGKLELTIGTEMKSRRFNSAPE